MNSNYKATMPNQKKPRLLVLLGTKAQFIKMAPLLLTMEKRTVPYTLVYSGQHSETFEAMQAAFGTREPDQNLMPSFEADTHLSFFGWTVRFWLRALRKRYRKLWRSHEILIIHGDTASTLYGAVLGRLFGMRVAHIEAGLRSDTLWDPFPEEMIRRLVSRLTSLHYCPSEWACSNLIRSTGSVINTHGNTLFDSLKMAIERQAADSSTPLVTEDSDLVYGIVSMHRNENLSRKGRLEELMQCVMQAAEMIPIKFVLHPATRKRMERSGWMDRLSSCSGIELLNRMEYFQFMELLLRARFLLTDGGSNQEEAAQLGIPCLLLRKTTERTDGLESTVEISGLRKERILRFVAKHKESRWQEFFAFDRVSSPSKIIAASLEKELSEN